MPVDEEKTEFFQKKLSDTRFQVTKKASSSPDDTDKEYKIESPESKGVVAIYLDGEVSTPQRFIILKLKSICR